MIKVCKKCGKEFEAACWNATTCNDCKIINCIICGKPFIPKTRGAKTCSKECTNISRANNVKKTCIEKYGVDNPAKLEKVQNKIKQTNLEKYGVENVYQLGDVKNKIKKTKLEKYNNENFTNNIKMQNTKLEKYGDKYYNNREKYKQTCISKYNSNTHMSDNNIKDKIKQTNLERYGVVSPLQNESVHNKFKNTMLNKYGVEYTAQSIELRNKMQSTMIKLYSYPFALQNNNLKQKFIRSFRKTYNEKGKDIRYKTSKTLLDKYNVNYPAQSKEIYNKVINTNLEKYGIEYACLLPQCLSANNKTISKVNKKFSELLKQNNIDNELEFHINKNSYDIHIINTNILIELNPTYTHNSTIGPIFKNIQICPKDKNYHLNKTKLAEEDDYHCIHIWDWDNWDKIINIFKPKKKISAHKTELKEVSKQEANEFLDKYHLQGSCNGNDINIGLFYKNELISLVTFGKPRYNKNYEYEFLRFVGHKDYSVYGGTNKLFNYFIEKYKPNSIISYCDKSKFEGKFFNNLGFIKEKETKPACHWYNLKTKQHFLDNSLRAIGADRLLNTNYGSIEKCGMNNRDIMLKEGFVEVYDCGQDVYTWKNN